MEAKTPVSLGIDPISGSETFRVYNYFKPNRDIDSLGIDVYYTEYRITPNGIHDAVTKKHYSVRDLKSGQIINNLDLPFFISELTENGFTTIPNPDLVPLAEDFNGFTDWFNYDIGIFPNGTTLGQVIEGEIDQTLASLPIGCKSGWIITEAA